jgi:hypothetical protein
MTRNSEIDRELMGSTVLSLSKRGNSANQISAAISENTGKNFSKQQIQRYVQINKNDNIQPTKLNATCNDIPPELKMLVAAYQGQPDQRDAHTEGVEYYGRFSVNTTNVFDEYYDIARGGISGQVTMGFVSLALKMTNGIRLITDESKQDSLDELSNYIKFRSLSQSIARSELEMGNVVTLLKDVDDNLTVPQITPMNYITLLTDKEKIGDTTNQNLIHGTVTKAVHDEANNPIEYDIDDIALFRMWSDDNYFIDIMGRNTFGIYGASMVPEIQSPLKSMTNASYYYDEFIKRYGVGRMHRDMRLIGELLKDGLMAEATVKEYMKEETAAQQKIKANEDYITMGQDLKMIETKHGFDITKYLEFREKQIDKALLQTDVSSGRVGSQFTSSGSEVSRQELIRIQSLRDTFFDTLLNQVVAPHLPDYNLKLEDVYIVAEPLSTIHVNHRDLLEAEAVGMITQGEARQRMGFPEEKPEVAL